MKLGILFSGGKDSTYAALLAKKEGYELGCLISIDSKNKESFMFHTPSISCVSVQAEAMGLPLVLEQTSGEKEIELEDLRRAITRAKEEYGVEGIVTGAVASVYQASRVQKICHELGLECFNPLWQKNQNELLEELIGEGFEIILSGVFAYPLDSSWLGRKIDEKFITEMKKLQIELGVNVAGEGGEFESLVLNCPLFSRALKVDSFTDSGEGHSWRREVVLT